MLGFNERALCLRLKLAENFGLNVGRNLLFDFFSIIIGFFLKYSSFSPPQGARDAELFSAHIISVNVVNAFLKINLDDDELFINF